MNKEDYAELHITSHDRRDGEGVFTSVTEKAAQLERLQPPEGTSRDRKWLY
jgi:hypothetical protein